MHKVQWAGRVVVASAAAVLLVNAAVVRAEVASDRAAAIVTLPYVEVNGDGRTADDTLIQLSNTSADPLDLHCFWENANSHCSNSGLICAGADDCCVMGICGTCDPGWNEVDFRVRLTPHQP